MAMEGHNRKANCDDQYLLVFIQLRNHLNYEIEVDEIHMKNSTMLVHG